MDLSAKVPVLLSADQIARRIGELATEIGRDYRGKDLVIVAVLKGSFVFVADLARQLDVPLRIDFLGLRSYGAGTESTGIVQITHDLTAPIEAQDVLVVEDIVDTGLTMAYLLDNLRTRHPRSLKLCALLHKPVRARIEIPIDYLGFTIPDKFVVGFGLDHDEVYRNLPYIGLMEGG